MEYNDSGFSTVYLPSNEKVNFVWKVVVLFSGMCFKNMNYLQGRKWSKIRDYFVGIVFNIFPHLSVSVQSLGCVRLFATP